MDTEAFRDNGEALSETGSDEFEGGWGVTRPLRRRGGLG